MSEKIQVIRKALDLAELLGCDLGENASVRYALGLLGDECSKAIGERVTRDGFGVVGATL